MSKKNAGTILVVDDDAYVLGSITAILREHDYSAIACKNAKEAIDSFQKFKIDVVLTDIRMPMISGLELLEKVHSIYPSVPVILMTAFAEIDIAVEAIKKGAYDFITKPFKSEYLIHAIKKAMEYNWVVQMEKNYTHMLENTVREKTQELANTLIMLKNMSKEIIFRLTAAAEYRDTDTGAHIVRIGLYSDTLAKALDMPADFIETLTFTSPMHDIGKIGIPDSILLKPGRLTDEENEVMKAHTTVGHNILADSSQPGIQMAASIALNHHERWDGSGYPRRLKGEDAPMEGRIVMLIDQYDALRSKRPYKQALSHQETFKIITEGDGRTLPEHFDPKVFNAFIMVAAEFDKIFIAHQD